MGPMLAKTLPWVRTTPLGSPVVPEVKRICSGVEADRSGTGPASSAGSIFWRSSNQMRASFSGVDRPLSFSISAASATISLGETSAINREHAAQHAPQKSREPLRGVFSPQHYPIAGLDTACGEQRREPAGPRGSFPIRRHAASIALITNDRDLASEAAKIVDQGCQVVAHEGRTVLAG